MAEEFGLADALLALADEDPKLEELFMEAFSDRRILRERVRQLNPDLGSQASRMLSRGVGNETLQSRAQEEDLDSADFLKVLFEVLQSDRRIDRRTNLERDFRIPGFRGTLPPAGRAVVFKDRNRNRNR